VKAVQSLSTVGDGHDVVAIAAKHGGQQLKRQIVVLGDQDPATRTHGIDTIMSRP
jgi:hypothetical protein